MSLTVDGNRGITNASWTVGTRPGSPVAGQQGYNTDLGVTETYDGSNWISLAAATTAAQFDNDTAVATTAFVQRALGNYSNSVQPSGASVVLDASNCGKTTILGGGTTAVTLPSLSTLAVGATINLIPQGQQVTISPAGSDTIFSYNGFVPNIVGNSWIQLTYIGTAWIVSMNTTRAISLASSGYYSMPNGLTYQWALLTPANASPANSVVNQAVTFPIAFTSAVLSINLSQQGGVSPAAGSYVNHDIESPSVTGFNWYIGCGSTGYAAGALKAYMFAIGY